MASAVRERLPVIRQLDQLAGIARGDRATYLRYSLGPQADARQTSRDYESGLELPGLSVVPLTPPGWWRRPVADWLARQVCKYAQLGEGDADRCASILTGRKSAAGLTTSRCWPIPIRWRSSASLVDQARSRYHECFEVGRDSQS